MLLKFFTDEDKHLCNIVSEYVPSLGDLFDITYDDIEQGTLKTIKITHKITQGEHTVILVVNKEEENQNE